MNRVATNRLSLAPGRPAMTYLIAYDICHPRRLRRVARFLERRGLHCQKSVFLVHAELETVMRLLDELAALLNVREDCVQAWKLSRDQADCGLVRGIAAMLQPACAVVQGTSILFVEKHDHEGTRFSHQTASANLPRGDRRGRHGPSTDDLAAG